MHFLPFGKLTNASIIPQCVRTWATVEPPRAELALGAVRSAAPSELRSTPIARI
jgi:hypothetical protein